MPLVAMLDGERVDSTNHSLESWTELRKSDDRKRLVMPLCGIRAIAKTRGSATRFFAHQSLSGCSVEHGGETAQHRALKAALAQFIDTVPGWKATVEYPHPSREWIIDVLAESDDGRERYAFEVQLSSQSPEEYIRRTDRYFASGILPVWLVPRRLECHPIKIPTIVTRFGKSSQIPEDAAKLMSLESSHDFTQERLTVAALGELVRGILVNRSLRVIESPERQAQLIREEAEREEAVRRTASARKAAFEEQVRVMNSRCSAPESVYGKHVVVADSESYVWASSTTCRGCGTSFLVWEADSQRPWERRLREPALRVKAVVGEKRYENHPDVHRVVNQWMKALSIQDNKALIEMRSTKRGIYSVFVCPGCRALMGQRYVARILPEHWSLIGAPDLSAGKDESRSAPEELPCPPLVAAPPSARCSTCGEAEHPHFTCIWRRHRAMAGVPEGGTHYTDSVHSRIVNGELPVDKGTQLLGRLFEQAATNKRIYGFVGSFQDLKLYDDDFRWRLKS